MAVDMQNVSWPGWETVKKIGSGSFGTVYEIQKEVSGHTAKAAMKVIRIPKDESQIQQLREEDYDNESLTRYFTECRERIECEYALMSDMKSHANVVNCDDIRTVQHENGFGWDIYIKMELLAPMQNWLKGEITQEQVIKLGIDICNALCLCEKLKVVHRDIKPSNIFVAPDGNYKLGDFGIARTMEGTAGGTKAGTYDYMAPEVYNNQAYHTSVDRYSLGMVLYWMLNERTGPFLTIGPQKPSARIKETARHRRFSGEAIPAPKHGCEELKRIVLKACAFDPKERYASAGDMKNALVQLQWKLEDKRRHQTEIVPEKEEISPVRKNQEADKQPPEKEKDHRKPVEKTPVVLNQKGFLTEREMQESLEEKGEQRKKVYGMGMPEFPVTVETDAVAQCNGLERIPASEEGYHRSGALSGSLWKKKNTARPAGFRSAEDLMDEL